MQTIKSNHFAKQKISYRTSSMLKSQLCIVYEVIREQLFTTIMIILIFPF